MNYTKNKHHTYILKQFSRSFRWTLSGSITYETLKVTHCFLLLKLFPATLYGSMGSLFSIIYLTTYIADMGATNSLPPFLHLFTVSRNAFRQFLIHYSLLPHMPIILVCASVATYFSVCKITHLPFLIIIPLVIILETIRTFMRLLLHTTFQARSAVIVELIIFALYLMSIWLPFLCFDYTMTLNHIFIPHLIDSTLTVIIFTFMLKRYYKTRSKTPSELPSNISKKLLRVRLFNYLLRVTRNMFTSNFLTPLFAVKFGLASAGLFYFASILANSIQAVIKSVIGYSGNALLANLKQEPQSIKKEAFQALCRKLTNIVAPVVIFLGVNYKTIMKLGASQHPTTHTIALSLLFLTISFSEFFFVLYEQFYIIEEAANKLFYFKLLEISIFMGLIFSSVITSPIATLAGLLAIRLVSFAIISINAYYLWHIKPQFKPNFWYITTCIIAALIPFFLF